jgi:2'-5' RNA ligase
MESYDAKPEENVRSFVCIEIPEAIKTRIGDLQRQLHGGLTRVTWVKPWNVHLTLRFLGHIKQSRITKVTEAIRRSASGVPPFELEVGGTGCFPSARAPKILWVGLTSVPDEATRLRAALDRELEKIGIERDSKRFSPHLTIGRIRSVQGGASLGQQLTGVRFEPERFQVSEFILMRSDLKPSGPVYHHQARVVLESRDAIAE